MNLENMQKSERGMRNRADRLRALNLPQRVTVELDAEGQPGAVRRSKDNSGGQAVEDILEIWRIDDEWWRAPVSRRYYEVVLDGGKRAVVFEDLMTGEWFEQKP